MAILALGARKSALTAQPEQSARAALATLATGTSVTANASQTASSSQAATAAHPPQRAPNTPETTQTTKTATAARATECAAEGPFTGASGSAGRSRLATQASCAQFSSPPIKTICAAESGCSILSSGTVTTITTLLAVEAKGAGVAAVRAAG